MCFVFISIPNRYNSKLTLLALPSVIYEPRFRGSIRNLVYSDQPNVPPRRQEMRQDRGDKKVSNLQFIDLISCVEILFEVFFQRNTILFIFVGRNLILWCRVKANCVDCNKTMKINLIKCQDAL